MRRTSIRAHSVFDPDAARTEALACGRRADGEDGPWAWEDLSSTMGVKLELICPFSGDGTGTELTGYSHRLEEEGARLTLIGEGINASGSIASCTEAQLGLSADGGRYEWKLRTWK